MLQLAEQRLAVFGEAAVALALLKQPGGAALHPVDDRDVHRHHQRIEGERGGDRGVELRAVGGRDEAEPGDQPAQQPGISAWAAPEQEAGQDDRREEADIGVAERHPLFGAGAQQCREDDDQRRQRVADQGALSPEGEPFEPASLRVIA